MNTKEIQAWRTIVAILRETGYDKLYDEDVCIVAECLRRCEQQVKKQKEVIDKTMSILKDNFVYDYVRSCDTTDEVGYDEIDTEHFTYIVYELLKEVSE